MLEIFFATGGKRLLPPTTFFWWSSSKTVSTKNAKMWEIWTISEDRSENRAILFVQIWRKSFSATGKKDFWFYFCATGGKDFLPFAATKKQILQQLFLGLSRTFYTQSYNPFCTKAVLICVNSWNSFLQFKSNLFSFWKELLLNFFDNYF